MKTSELKNIIKELATNLMESENSDYTTKKEGIVTVKINGADMQYEYTAEVDYTDSSWEETHDSSGGEPQTEREVTNVTITEIGEANEGVPQFETLGDELQKEIIDLATEDAKEQVMDIWNY